jgi:hypothetical protein
MNSQFNNPTIVGVARQTQPATAPDHLVRYGELLALLASVALGNSYSGVVDVDADAAGGTVTGLSLGFVPTKVLLTVRAPAGGDRLGLNAQSVGAPDATGFTWEFTNGTPDAAGYKLFYLLLA